MKELSIEQIKNAVKGELVVGSGVGIVTGISHNSKTVKENDLFFALIGDVHDAHKFIISATERGCRNFVVSHMEWAKDNDELIKKINVIKVDDTKIALQRLASEYLKMLDVKVIGVTGSTGKTSTRDMVYAVCCEEFNTGKTVGNFNNDIGLPQTILGFEDDLDVIVLEMGMDHFGEIELLANIAKPDIGLITNIGISHMENLGSRQGIMKAKMEITSCFNEENTLIISRGDDFLRKENIKGNYNIVDTGFDSDNDYAISNFKDLGTEGIEFEISINDKENESGEITQKFRLPVAGKHNALNATMAVAAGRVLGVSMEKASKGLASMELTGGRLTMKKSGTWTIIDDTYNASPDSVKRAIDVLEVADTPNRIAVLGDMYELGKDSEKWHRDVGEYAGVHNVTKVVAIGMMASKIAEGAGDKGIYFATKEEFVEEISKYVPEDATILVKGSRGMTMEKIVDALIDRGEKK